MDTCVIAGLDPLCRSRRLVCTTCCAQVHPLTYLGVSQHYGTYIVIICPELSQASLQPFNCESRMASTLSAYDQSGNKLTIRFVQDEGFEANVPH
jgi:hypothetical protein